MSVLRCYDYNVDQVIFEGESRWWIFITVVNLCALVEPSPTPPISCQTETTPQQQTVVLVYSQRFAVAQHNNYYTTVVVVQEYTTTTSVAQPYGTKYKYSQYNLYYSVLGAGGGGGGGGGRHEHKKKQKQFPRVPPAPNTHCSINKH